MKWTIVLAFMLLASCSHNKDKHDEPDLIGKFIYVDDMNVYHVNPGCFRLQYGNDDDGHKIYAKHPIDTADFVMPDIEMFRVCSYCVSDNNYEHMLRLSEANSADSTIPSVDSF